MEGLLGPAVVTLWLISIVHTLFLVGVLRQLGMIHLRLGFEAAPLITREGLERGTQAPDFDGIAVRSGEQLRLDDLRGHPVLLFFLTPTCASCKQLTPHINALAKDWPEVRMVAVVYGTAAVVLEFADAYRLQVPIVADERNAIAERYDVRFTPFVYLLNEAGSVQIRGVANTWPQLEALLEQQGVLTGRPVLHRIDDGGRHPHRPLPRSEPAREVMAE